MAGTQELVKALNEALAEEYAQYIEMATQAAVTRGPDALTLKPFFEEQAAGALAHAALLRERIFNLGGTLSTGVGEVRVHPSSGEALEAGAGQHRTLVQRYRDLLALAVRHQMKDGDLLYETLEEILDGEQRDLEAFRRLSSGS